MLDLLKLPTPVTKKTLCRLANETITPQLAPHHFRWNNHLAWIGKKTNAAQPIFKYLDLRGAQGTFAWGVRLDFVPTIWGTHLVYSDNDLNPVQDLFEFTDEYSNSFEGGQLQGGVTSHWGEKNTRSSINILFDKYRKKIFDWFERCHDLDHLVTIAKQQADAGKYCYNIRSPHPQLVLAFLYARKGQLEKAHDTFARLNDYTHEKLNARISEALLKTSLLEAIA